MKKIDWEIVGMIAVPIVLIGAIAWLVWASCYCGKTGHWPQMTWYWWALVIGGGMSLFIMILLAPCEHTDWE